MSRPLLRIEDLNRRHLSMPPSPSAVRTSEWVTSLLSREDSFDSNPGPSSQSTPDNSSPWKDATVNKLYENKENKAKPMFGRNSKIHALMFARKALNPAASVMRSPAATQASAVGTPGRSPGVTGRSPAPARGRVLMARNPNLQDEKVESPRATAKSGYGQTWKSKRFSNLARDLTLEPAQLQYLSKDCFSNQWRVEDLSESRPASGRSASSLSSNSDLDYAESYSLYGGGPFARRLDAFAGPRSEASSELLLPPLTSRSTDSAAAPGRGPRLSITSNNFSDHHADHRAAPQAVATARPYTTPRPPSPRRPRSHSGSDTGPSSRPFPGRFAQRRNSAPQVQVVQTRPRSNGSGGRPAGLSGEDSLSVFTSTEHLPTLDEQLNCQPLILTGTDKVRFLWQRAYKSVVSKLLSDKICALENVKGRASPRTKQVIGLMTEHLRAVRRWKQVGNTATFINRMKKKPQAPQLPEWANDEEVNASMSAVTPFFTLVNKLIVANRVCRSRAGSRADSRPRGSRRASAYV